MDLLIAIREGMDHHYWARDRQLQAAAALTQEQFLRPVGGSFPSLRDTFAHMLAVEWLWLERWRGGSPKALIPAGEFPVAAAVAERWSAVEGGMRAFLAGLDAEALERPSTYTKMRGGEFTYPLWRMLAHLLNHQSYHRGQASTLLGLLGVKPPPVDLLVAHDMHFRL